MISKEPDLAVIILAAGRSSRMMGTNKLLEKLAGKSLIRTVAEHAIASGIRPIIVVTGHQADHIHAEIGDLDIQFVHNPNYADGLSTSLQAGLRILPEHIDGALIMLGDMPLITPNVLQKLMDAFRASPACLAAVPSYHENWGNPVLLARSLFKAASELTGDSGARKLLEMHRDQVIEVTVADDSVTIDLDTPEAFNAARTLKNSGSSTQ